jgi:cytochrome c553
MSSIKKIAGWGSLTVVAAVVIGAIASWQSEIAPLEEKDHHVFSQQQIAQGKVLADLGDCAVCHTRPGGERNYRRIGDGDSVRYHLQHQYHSG